MTRDFSTTELLSALGGFGIAVRRCMPLPGHAHSLNFRVETAAGETIVAKCFPSAKRRMFARLLAHTASAPAAFCSAALFGGRTVTFGAWEALALKWIAGRGIRADRLTVTERTAMLSAYEEFRHGLVDDGQILPVRQGRAVKQALLALLDKDAAPEIVAELRRMDDAVLDLPPQRLRIIHGDLHDRNFHFANGRVAGFLDLEEFRWGTPAEDFVRYIVCCTERLPWTAFAARRRARACFAGFLRETQIPRDEWLFAIHGYLLRKLARKIKSPHVSWGVRLNLAWRFRFYRQLCAAVDSAFPTVDGTVCRRWKKGDKDNA